MPTSLPPASPGGEYREAVTLEIYISRSAESFDAAAAAAFKARLAALLPDTPRYGTVVGTSDAVTHAAKS